MKTLTVVPAALLAIVAQSVALAEEPVPNAVHDAVAKLAPGVAADEISPAPVSGMYQVVVGPHLFYVSSDGRYMVRGEIVDLESRKNVTEPVRNRARAAAIDALGEESMIIFSPASPTDRVTVFTDVDCGYCAKLHREINDYLAQGIAVRYIAFPRAGVPSETYDTMVSVWCSDDRQKAIGEAKARRPVAAKTCNNPVANQYEMGRQVGVRGTPTIVMESGDIIPGYLPAAELKKAIREAKAAVASKG